MASQNPTANSPNINQNLYQNVSNTAKAASTPLNKAASFIDQATINVALKYNQALNLVDQTVSKFTGNLNNLGKAVEEQTKGFNALNNSFKNFKPPDKGLKTLEDRLTLNFEKITLLIGAYFDFTQALDVVKTGLEGVAKTLEAASGADLAKSLFEATGAGGEAIAQLELLQAALFGNTEAIKAFGAVSTAELIKFEQSLERVNTIAKLGPTALKELKKSTIDLAAALGNVESSAALLDAQYEVLSGGFTKTTESQQVSATAIKLNTVGFGNLTDSTQLLVKSLKAYGESSAAAEVTASKLQKIVELGITTIPELSQSFGETATVAKAAGVDINELGAAVATLTAKGQSTPTALTGIESLLRTVIDQSPEATQAISQLRDSAGKPIKFDLLTIKKEGLVGPLTALNDALKGNAAELRKIFPDSQAFQTALSLLANSATEFKDNVNKMKESTVDDFDAVFNSVAGSKAKTLDAVINKIKDLVIDFGESFAPTFLAAVNTLSGFINSVKSIPVPIKEGFASLAVFSIGLGVFTNTIGTAISSLIALGTSIGSIILFNAAMSNGFNILNSDLAKNVTIVKALIGSGAGLEAVIKQTVGISQVSKLNAEGRLAVAQAASKQVDAEIKVLDEAITEALNKIEIIKESNSKLSSGTLTKGTDEFKQAILDRDNAVNGLKSSLGSLDQQVATVGKNINKNIGLLDSKSLVTAKERTDQLNSKIAQLKTTAAQEVNIKAPTSFAQNVKDLKTNKENNIKAPKDAISSFGSLNNVIGLLDNNLQNTIITITSIGEALLSVAAAGVVGLKAAFIGLLGVLKTVGLALLGLLANPVFLSIAALGALVFTIYKNIEAQKEYEKNSKLFSSALLEQRDAADEAFSSSIKKLQTTTTLESDLYRKRIQFIKAFQKASIEGSEVSSKAFSDYLKLLETSPNVAKTAFGEDVGNIVKLNKKSESLKGQRGLEGQAQKEESKATFDTITKVRAEALAKYLEDNKNATESDKKKVLDAAETRARNIIQASIAQEKTLESNGLKEAFDKQLADNKKTSENFVRQNNIVLTESKKGLIQGYNILGDERVVSAQKRISESIINNSKIKDEDVALIIEGNKRSIAQITSNIDISQKALDESRKLDKEVDPTGTFKGARTKQLEQDLARLNEEKTAIEKVSQANQDLIALENQKRLNREVFAEKTGLGRLQVAAKQAADQYNSTLRDALSNPDQVVRAEAAKNLETYFQNDITAKLTVVPNLDVTSAQKNIDDLRKRIKEAESTGLINPDKIKEQLRKVYEAEENNTQARIQLIQSVGTAYEALGQLEVDSAIIAKRKVAALNIQAAEEDVKSKERTLSNLQADKATSAELEKATSNLNQARGKLASAQVSKVLLEENTRYKQQTELINLLSENYKILSNIRKSVFEAVGSTSLAAEIEADAASRAVSDNEKLLQLKREQVVLQQKLAITDIQSRIAKETDPKKKDALEKELSTANELNSKELERLKIQEQTSRVQVESEARAARTKSLIEAQNQATQRLQASFDISEKQSQLDVKRKEALGDIVGAAQQQFNLEKERSALLPTLLAGEEKIAAIKRQAAITEIDLQIKSATSPADKAKLESQKQVLLKDLEIQDAQRRQTAEITKQNQAYQEQEAKINLLLAPIKQQQIQLNVQRDILSTQADTLELRNSLLSKAYDLEKRVTEAFNATTQAAASYDANRLSILGELTDNEEEQKNLARQAAEIKLQALISQQQSETVVLNIQREQEKSLLEQEKLRIRLSKIDVQGKVLEAQGKVAEFGARVSTAKTPEEKAAAILQLSAAQQQIALLQQQSTLYDQSLSLVDTQASQSDALFQEQLKAKSFTDASARDSARAEVFKNLSPEQQDLFRDSFRNSITRGDLATNTALNTGLNGFLDAGTTPNRNAVNSQQKSQQFSNAFKETGTESNKTFTLEGVLSSNVNSTDALRLSIDRLNELYGASKSSPQTLEDLNKQYTLKPSELLSKLPEKTKLEVPSLPQTSSTTANTSNRKDVKADFNVNIKVEGTKNETTEKIEEAARDVFGRTISTVKSLLGV